jgi:ADP-ribose pyrophosphatase YjhB (NUDIX family)
MTRDRFRAEFKLPFTGFYERFTPGIPMAQLEAWFHERFREIEHTVEEMPHAREFLEFCRASGLKTLLLSTMHPEHFAAQTRRNRFDELLDHPYLGVWDKREKIQEILATHGLSPAETVFIGTWSMTWRRPGGGIQSVGVLTGYNSGDQRRARADLDRRTPKRAPAVLERHGMRLKPPTATWPLVRRPVVTVGAAISIRPDGSWMAHAQMVEPLGIPGESEAGEACEASARREAEETGPAVEDVRFVLVQDCIGSREFYREEHFVLLNTRVRRRGDVLLNEEAQEFRWVSMAEALALNLNRPTRVLLEAIGTRSAEEGGGNAEGGARNAR